jgi:uncharacterized repeat protein (TIGR01451 family)
MTPMTDSGNLKSGTLAWNSYVIGGPLRLRFQGTGNVPAPTPTPTPTPSASSTPDTGATAIIGLVKTVDKTSAVSGDILIYSITAKNTSSTAKANPVKISDVIPAGTTFVSGSDNAVLANGKVTWNFIGGMNPGQSSTVSFQVRVN